MQKIKKFTITINLIRKVWRKVLQSCENHNGEYCSKVLLLEKDNEVIVSGNTD